MKISMALAVTTVAALAACSRAPEVPSPPPVPTEPPVSALALQTAEPATPPAGPVDATFTAFTPATNEIHCSFFTIGDDGLPGERVFITEISGVPAPARIGFQGESLPLTQVSKDDAARPQVWVYGNGERGVQVELNMTETAKGFESRDYEGTIRLIEPKQGPVTAITGTCGV